jgi:hypothetical protein
VQIRCLDLLRGVRYRTRANAIHFIDRLIEIKTIFLQRRFLDVVADAIDDGSGSIGIAHDTAERFPDFPQVPAPAAAARANARRPDPAEL